MLFCVMGSSVLHHRGTLPKKVSSPIREWNKVASHNELLLLLRSATLFLASFSRWPAKILQFIFDQPQQIAFASHFPSLKGPRPASCFLQSTPGRCLALLYEPGSTCLDGELDAFCRPCSCSLILACSSLSSCSRVTIYTQRNVKHSTDLVCIKLSCYVLKLKQAVSILKV